MAMLVTSAGRRVELLRSFWSSAAALGVELDLFACDLRPDWSPACHEAGRAFAVPRADDPDYADVVLELCRDNGISLVVPTIDTELHPLALARDRFAAIGATVSVSSPALVGIARDKLRTAEFLAQHHIASPRSAPLDAVEAAAAEWSWPLLVKPAHGSSGRGVQIVHDIAELRRIESNEPFIAQELLRGREHTVNMFFDRSGQLRCAVPHERIQIRAGEVEKGITRRSPQLARLAADMAAALPEPRGALCFQAMVDDAGEAKIFEINARFGGGYPLAHHAGATFSTWLLEEALGRAPGAHDAWRADVIMLRYDAAVFVGS
ncbi:ATP-grasp domain-containing protein [Sphingomonas cavernae]|uniref:ATP-grasp domain-containing protein n=1 Tax=Sphingomonas cavernae TaxID=2320861 RepID=A0A418WSW5_9SPHN|nr:ATP-grasp domain-containing protein [Sphingomonas cavernae]